MSENATKKITSYPFKSKTEIAEQISRDPEFALEMFGVMQMRQTSSERDCQTTTERNKAGWMSSHAKRAAKIAVVLGEGPPSDAVVQDVQELVSHYTRQLAAHLRALAIQNRPELAEAARVFSAKVA